MRSTTLRDVFLASKQHSAAQTTCLWLACRRMAMWLKGVTVDRNAPLRQGRAHPTPPSPDSFSIVCRGKVLPAAKPPPPPQFPPLPPSAHQHQHQQRQQPPLPPVMQTRPPAQPPLPPAQPPLPPTQPPPPPTDASGAAAAPTPRARKSRWS